MKSKNVLKRLLCLCMAALLACGITVSTASAKNGYYDGDFYEEVLNDPDESYKGVQGATEGNQYTDSKGKHGISHTFGNIHLNNCIFPKNSGRGYAYSFEGEIFRLDVDTVIWLARNANENGMTCNLQFMIPWNGSSETAFLVDESARESGHAYYAPATSGYGKKAIRAFWKYLMEELTNEGLHVDNFIWGNEVNMPDVWYYSGTEDPWDLTGKYASAFYDMYSTVRQYSDTARCSVCVDHTWYQDAGDAGVGAREFLDNFNAHLKNYASDVDWCVSTHIYPAVLWDARIWEEPHAEAVGYELTTDSAYTPYIDGSNLAVMTNYIRDTFGEEHRVMLTEQGFTQAQGADVQAAALAYSYYAAKYDPMVDCLILHMADEGYLYDFYGNYIPMNFELLPLAEEVFCRIGSTDPKDVKWIADKCLPVIGVSSWEEIIPNYGVEPVPAVDYSAVFDAEYYYSHNADLAAGMAYNKKALLEHFVDHGMAEGRRASAQFDLNAYKEYNQDLAAAFGNDNKSYYMHYIEFGKAEGRTAVYKNSVEQPTDVSRYASVFDANYYYENNPDLANGLRRDDVNGLFNHFMNYGMAEGRQASAEFNLDVYKITNPDLAGYGSDNKNYYLHYNDFGKAEGRTASYSQYAPIFDMDYYYNNQSDLAQGLGYDQKALFIHFYEHGMAEGRQASAEFNVEAYKANNSDLAADYGGDNRRYYLHYMNYGKDEGRVASFGSSQGIVDIEEYSAVYDGAFYREHNPDLAGYSDEELFLHFVDHGMAEGRQATSEFNLDVYKVNNADLSAEYADDNRRYYMHYISAGKAENRMASDSVYDLVYDHDYYYSNNPDLANGGYDSVTLFKHFINHGMIEGRIASPDFNVHVYREKNPDLQYGENWITYFQHYINHGYSEGRSGK